jgi:hypothetical protein
MLLISAVFLSGSCVVEAVNAVREKLEAVLKKSQEK